MREVRLSQGCIEAEISENSIARRSAELVHTITAGQDSGSQLSLQATGIEMRKWSDLENRHFSYPSEPVAGYTDGEEIEIGSRVTGTLDLDGRTHSVRVIDLAFGRISEGSIPVRISIVGATLEPLIVEVELELGSVKIRGDIAKVHPPKRDAALALGARFVDIQDFTEAEDGEFLSLRPKVEKMASTLALPRE